MMDGDYFESNSRLLDSIELDNHKDRRPGWSEF